MLLYDIHEKLKILEPMIPLGSLMSSTETDLKLRKSLAWSAFWKMEKIWKSKTLSIRIKVCFFIASCISILSYGSETWILNQKQRAAIDSFATNAYRIMLNIKRTDHVTNEAIYGLVKQKPLSTTLIIRQLTWVGHMLRREKDELVRKYALYRPAERHGIHKKGRPSTTFLKYIADIINSQNPPTENEIEKAAQNRSEWKKLVVVCTEKIT